MRFRTTYYSLLVPLALVAIAISALFVRADPPVACEPFAEILRIKITTALLSVPRRYDPNIYGPDGKFVGDAKEICQRADDPPLHASAVTIKPDSEPPFNLSPDPVTRPIWKVQVRIRERPNSFKGPEQEYASAVGWVEDSGNQFSALPHKHGFLAYDSSPQGSHFYFSLPDAAQSLDPTPLLIKCSAHEFESPDKRIYFGRACSTGYYTVSNTLMVSYKFYDGQHPIETWRQLDASVRAFVRRLVKDSG